MPNANGSMWVQGDYLYWRDSANTRWRFLGSSIATPAGAKKGSVWMEANTIHYIDETAGVERSVSGPAIAAAPAEAKAGSVWIDTGYVPSSANGQLHFLGDTSHEFWAHNDTAHTDVTFVNSHTDVTPHTNTHNDSPHGNTHNNTFEPLGHFDFGDYYEHADGHNDAPAPYSNSHSDVPHQNITHVDKPETV